jgi:hypothetical protein
MGAAEENLPGSVNPAPDAHAPDGLGPTAPAGGVPEDLRPYLAEAPVESAGAGSLPDPAGAAPSADMDPLATQPTPTVLTGGDLPPADPDMFPAVSGPLRPANEVLLEQLSPTSPVFRRRAFASMLRVLLAGKVE